MRSTQNFLWLNLHAYFKLGLQKTNFLVLALMLPAAYATTTSISTQLRFLIYGIVGFILCNQFIGIYLNNLKSKKNIPNLTQLFKNKNIGLTLRLYVFFFILIYSFFYVENSTYLLTLYNSFLLLYCPAMIICLLLQNSLIYSLNPPNPLFFIYKHFFAYLFCLITILLIFLGFKTICYYANIWLVAEFYQLLLIELGAYLFLVSAYLFAELGCASKEEVQTDQVNNEFILIKQYIASENLDKVHDFFKKTTLSYCSEELLDFYLKLLLNTEDDLQLNNFGNRWITSLFQQKKIKKAVSVYGLIFKKKPDFLPLENLTSYTLAQHFFATKNFQIVIQLLKTIPKNNANFRYLPEVFLMLSKSYIALNLDIKAKKTILLITENYPQSECYQEAIILQKILLTRLSN